MNAGFSDIFLGDKSLVQSSKKIYICAAAVNVAACFQRQSRRANRGLCQPVMLVEILDSPAVGNKISVKAPAAELFHKHFAGAGSLTVYPVVCAHNALNVNFFHKRFKSGEIGLLQILFGNLRIEFVAESFGAAVNCKMLCAGSCAESFALTLKSLYISLAVFCGEIWVLAVGLVTTSPAGVTENVDVGRSEGKTLVNISVTVLCVLGIFCTGLLGGYLACLFHKLCVKHGGKSDRLGEHGGCA